MDELLEAPTLNEIERAQLEYKQKLGLLTRNDKLALKKYWLMNKFHLKPEDFTMEFLLHWYGKEHIFDNLLYALGKKTIVNPQDPYLNKVPQKIQYLNMVLKIYGFDNLFDTKQIQKDDLIEKRMKDSGLLDFQNYQKLMQCFEKRIQSKEHNVFSVKKYTDLTDMILNEFGFTIKSQKKRVREGEKRKYDVTYCLEEFRKGISMFINY